MHAIKAHLFKKQYFIVFGCMFGVSLFASLAEGASFSWMYFAFNTLSSSVGSVATDISQQLPLVQKTFALLKVPKEQLFFACIFLALFFQILRSVLAYIGKICAGLLATSLQKEFQVAIYRQILELSFPYVNRYKVGDLADYVKTPPLITQEILDGVNRSLLSFCFILMFFGLMMLLSWKLTLLAIVLFGGCTLLQKQIVRKIARVSYSFSEHQVTFSKQIIQTLHSLRVVHLFNQQTAFRQKSLISLEKISQSLRKIHALNYLIPSFNEVVGTVLVALFLGLGQFILSIPDPIPVLLTFTAILHRLNTKVQELVQGIATTAQHSGRISRINDILTCHDKQFTRTTGAPIKSFSKEITLNSLSLRYPNAKESSLKNISLTIPKGSVTAFVGHSGAGKSSLIDLLIGLYEPNEGSILIDGKNLEELSLFDWRDLLGVVSQESFILYETIEENIRFGNTSATKQEVEQAAHLAGAHEFITQLPEGYQTLVGERGYRLSGGERQRISLARALIRDPQVLILDEATSNLDSHSESLIQEALQTLRKTKTIIIVAHRLSTVVEADQIYLLDQGRLSESGSHSHLLEKMGKYAYFWGLQTKSLELSTNGKRSGK